MQVTCSSSKLCQKKQSRSEEGAKTSFKEALLTLKNSEELNAQPSHTPVIVPVQPEEIDPEKETVKNLSEIFDKWLTEDGKFKDQVIEANKVNSNRISTNEVAMLRKHFEDENYKLYVTKINMNGIVYKNGWELAQDTKKAIKSKITEINREEADKMASVCKIEHFATSAYLQLVRAMDSSKVDAMGRDAKHDTKLGYKTIPLCITFGTLEDKNAFKDSARSLELNCKDSVCQAERQGPRLF